MDPNEITRLGHAPRWALKLIAINAAVWLIGLPLMMLIKTGYINWLIFALAGAACIPLVLAWTFVQRILLWFALARFWFWQSLGAAFGIAAAALVFASMTVIDVSGLQPAGIGQINTVALVLAVAGVITVIGIGLIIRRRRQGIKGDEKPLKSKPSITASDWHGDDRTPERKLSYLDEWASRKRD